MRGINHRHAIAFLVEKSRVCPLIDLSKCDLSTNSIKPSTRAIIFAETSTTVPRNLDERRIVAKRFIASYCPFHFCGISLVASTITISDRRRLKLPPVPVSLRYSISFQPCPPGSVLTRILPISGPCWVHYCLLSHPGACAFHCIRETIFHAPGGKDHKLERRSGIRVDLNLSRFCNTNSQILPPSFSTNHSYCSIDATHGFNPHPAEGHSNSTTGYLITVVLEAQRVPNDCCWPTGRSIAPITNPTPATDGNRCSGSENVPSLHLFSCGIRRSG